jgi:hypothetical protein
VDEGKKILMNSGFNFVVTDTMKDAADKVVAAARFSVEQGSELPFSMTIMVAGYNHAVRNHTYGNPS